MFQTPIVDDFTRLESYLTSSNGDNVEMYHGNKKIEYVNWEREKDYHSKVDREWYNNYTMTFTGCRSMLNIMLEYKDIFDRPENSGVRECIYERLKMFMKLERENEEEIKRYLECLYGK